MKRVAKLVIVDKEGNYLLMYRSDHPTFGRDPDLPGGTLEVGESTLETMIREVREEIGVAIAADEVRELYGGSEYSMHSTYYALYMCHLDTRPSIVMSWEHSAYTWVSKAEFLSRANGAKDTYMHMVYAVVSKST